MAKYKTSTTLQIDDYKVTIRRASPRKALIAGFDLLAQVGPTLAGLLTGAGVRVSDTEVIPLGALLELFSESADRDRAYATMTALVGQLLRHVGAVDGAKVAEIAEALLVDCCDVTDPEGRTRTVVDPALLDVLLPSPWALLGVIKAALELNLSPTSAGGGGDHPPARRA